MEGRRRCQEEAGKEARDRRKKEAEAEWPKTDHHGGARRAYSYTHRDWAVVDVQCMQDSRGYETPAADSELRWCWIEVE